MPAATKNTSQRRSNDGDPPPPQQEEDEGRYYSIDIRVFLLLVTLTMAASFIAGVTLIPPIAVTKTTSFQSDGVVRDAFLLGHLTPSQQQEEEDLHRPSGQHLLVDMKGVDSDFLNNEERLAQAMVDTVRESGLTMLSYHCHALLPSGVSCVGILLESHSKFGSGSCEGWVHC